METIRRLAALKAQRELAKLAEAKARVAAEAAKGAAAERAAAETYPETVDSAAELQALWRMRAALETRRAALRDAEAARAREAEAARGKAAAAKARELGAEALAARARAARAAAEVRRSERIVGVLAALRRPGS